MRLEGIADELLTDERRLAFNDARAKAISARAAAHRAADAEHEIRTRQANADYEWAVKVAALRQIKAEIAVQEIADEPRDQAVTS